MADDDYLPPLKDLPDTQRVRELHAEAKRLWADWDQRLETMSLEMYRRTLAELKEEVVLEKTRAAQKTNTPVHQTGCRNLDIAIHDKDD